MSSFFSIPGAKKRKTTTASEKPRKRIATSKPGRPTAKGTSSKGAASSKSKTVEREDSISGSDIDDDESIESVEDAEEGGSGSESEREGETAAERRLRLAEQYLSNISKEIQDDVGFDARDVDRELLAERIQLDVSEAKGRVYRSIANELDFENSTHCYFKNNSESWTSVALRAPYAYTTTKDLYVHKWRIQDLPKDQWPQTRRKKPKNAPPPKKKPELEQWIRGNALKSKDNNYKRHLDRILCVAVSSDGKFLVTGGEDKRLIVHDAVSLKPIKVFTHHRDAVTGLAFRRGTNQLYSCSKDRTVKVWSLDELAYVETLFGHQDEVVDIDALAQERCVSVGARDRTARLWKVVEETQLVFRGGGSGVDKKNPLIGVDPRSVSHEGSMDRIAMLDDDLFVTGSDNGALSLWSVAKKKPLHIIPIAHGLEEPLLPTEASAEQAPDADVVPPPQPRWITALRAIPYSDLVLSGSWDGHVRVWKLSDDKRKLERLGVLCGGKPADGEETESGPMIRGIVNDIAVCERGERAKDGICIVAVVGTQHRSGRWKIGKGKGKNGGYVFEVPRTTTPAVNGHHEDADMESD